MATSTELLRAAEHMRKRFLDGRDRSDLDASIALTIEAERLQAVETQRFAQQFEAFQESTQPSALKVWGAFAHACQDERVAIREGHTRRSWPEGWPPFAVLRRAYALLDITPMPSTRWLENNGYKHDLDRARSIRADWAEALAAEVYGELPP